MPADKNRPPVQSAALVVPPAGPAPATLAESLLLQCLNEISAVGSRLSQTDQRIARTEAQNETIIVAIARADLRQDAADESRGTMHKRINEISENVASIEVNVENQAARLDVLDPIVASLKDAALERHAIRKAIAGLMKNTYARAGAAALAGGTAWHQWELIRDAVLRFFHLKIGG